MDNKDSISIPGPPREIIDARQRESEARLRQEMQASRERSLLATRRAKLRDELDVARQRLQATTNRLGLSPSPAERERINTEVVTVGNRIKVLEGELQHVSSILKL